MISRKWKQTLPLLLHHDIWWILLSLAVNMQVCALLCLTGKIGLITTSRISQSKVRFLFFKRLIIILNFDILAFLSRKKQSFCLLFMWSQTVSGKCLVSHPSGNLFDFIYGCNKQLEQEKATVLPTCIGMLSVSAAMGLLFLPAMIKHLRGSRKVYIILQQFSITCFFIILIGNEAFRSHSDMRDQLIFYRVHCLKDVTLGCVYIQKCLWS